MVQQQQEPIHVLLVVPVRILLGMGFVLHVQSINILPLANVSAQVVVLVIKSILQEVAVISVQLVLILLEYVHLVQLVRYP